MPRTVDDLVDQLTVEEKLAMLHQYSPAVPRLGLRAFRTGTEALHGVAWLGEATVFPQAVGLGATWHPELVERVGEVGAIEVRAKHAADPTVSLNVWAPVVNLLRDPRWGRNEEGYSEDPLHASSLAIAYCRGLRGDHPDGVRTAPTLKHFQAYNNEVDRDRTSSVLRARVLHEYDLPAFAGPIQAGVVDAVMPSYNLVNGRPAHLSPDLKTLRAWSEHELLMVSDAEAPTNLVQAQHYFADHETAHAAALLAGIDSFTERGAEPSFTVDVFTRALNRGLISEADLDRAVRRVLTIRSRTGEFDPALDPYASIGPDALNRPEHRQLARQAAREQVVLLKNAGDLLPLTAAGLRVAVVGPFASTLCADWYSGTMPYRVTIADGLRRALEAQGGMVTSVDGVDRIALRATSRDDIEEAQFDVFDWGDGVSTLRAAQNGRYVTVKDDGNALVADQVQPNGWEVHETFNLLDQDDGTVVLRNIYTGRYVALDPTGTLRATAEHLETAERFAKTVVRIGLDAVQQALQDADVAIVVVGNDPHINGRETQDRRTLALPPAQETLVKAVGSAHARTVLVVMSSYPYALTWAKDSVPAILWTSHAGQETGNAIADVLLGVHSPTGRLPQTWYRSDDDLPGILEYDIIKARRTYQYFDGTALYPFGHGLTYTTFDYAASRVSRPGSGPTVTVQVEVTNTGSRPGVEVVQVYTRLTGPTLDRPARRLAGWSRVWLEPGLSRTVTVDFPLSSLAIWDVERHGSIVEPGTYEVLVGSSCTDIHGTADLVVTGDQPGPRQVVGIDVTAADFDDYAGITLVDTTREAGDAVEAVDRAAAWVLFRAADLSTIPTRLTVRVSQTLHQSSLLELRTGKPDGPVLATAVIPSTGDRYAWVDVTTEIVGAHGVQDLYLLLHGDFRIDTFRLHD